MPIPLAVLCAPLLAFAALVLARRVAWPRFAGREAPGEWLRNALRGVEPVVAADR